MKETKPVKNLKKLNSYWKKAKERKTFCTIKIHNLQGNILAISKAVIQRLREASHQELVKPLEKELQGASETRALKVLNSYVKLV